MGSHCLRNDFDISISSPSLRLKDVFLLKLCDILNIKEDDREANLN